MAKGSDNTPFTFPLITVPITDTFHFDNPMFLYLLDKLYRWGGVYFENFRIAPFQIEKYKKINPYIKAKGPSVSRSLCCRLNIEVKKIFSDLIIINTNGTYPMKMKQLSYLVDGFYMDVKAPFWRLTTYNYLDVNFFKQIYGVPMSDSLLQRLSQSMLIVVHIYIQQN